MADDDQYDEETANADAIRFSRRRIEADARKLAESEEWKKANAITRIILRAEMLERCEEADSEENERRPTHGFLNDRAAQRIADAVLGRMGEDDVWRDPPPADQGRRYGRPGEVDGIVGVIEHIGERMPEPREWLVDQLIPRGRVTLLSAEGDAGKSRLLLQLAATITTGGGFWPARWKGNAQEEYGAAVYGPPDGGEPENVLLVTWEDEVNEIRRRLGWAAAAESTARGVRGIPLEALQSPARTRLDVLDMRKVGGPIWGPRKSGSRHTSTEGELTGAGRSILASLAPNRYGACIIDPLAAAFTCNENDRGLVRQFASTIDLAGEEADCSMFLVGHPPKGKTSYAGSTDWRNSVRSMLTLQYKPTSWVRADGLTPDGLEGKGEKGGEKALIKAPRLACEKSNYARRTGFWLVKFNSAGPPQGLAWFAANEYEAAREALAALLRERLGDDAAHADLYPAIIGSEHPDAKRPRGEAEEGEAYEQETVVPDGFTYE